MENVSNSEINSDQLIKQFYKPDYDILFNKIKSIKTPIKTDLLKALLDGSWHSELELIRIAKKQEKYVGTVTLGTIVRSLNHVLTNDYVEKKIINEKLFYKLSDNYVGLTRAAYTKYQYVNHKLE